MLPHDPCLGAARPRPRGPTPLRDDRRRRVRAPAWALLLLYRKRDRRTIINGAILIAPILALYSVASQVSLRRAFIAAFATLAILLTVTAARNPFGHISGGGFDIIPFMVAAALFAGIAVANRNAYVASIRDRAEQDARRRLDEERLRIARELHDVVAHTMATINVQAGVAAHVLPTRPEAAAESLQAIKTASKEGLRELRAILNVLRQADDADPTQPAPGTAQLEDLIAGARRAGVARQPELAVLEDQRPEAGGCPVDRPGGRIAEHRPRDRWPVEGAGRHARKIRHGLAAEDEELARVLRNRARDLLSDLRNGGHGAVAPLPTLRELR